MKQLIRTALLATALIGALLPASQVQAQDTEEQFHDLFITAGYSTAFGAALGAAFLGLTDDPSSKLSYVYVGASLGFIGGSILGTYVIFTPMFLTEKPNTSNSDNLLSSIPQKSGGIAVRPVIDLSSGTLTGLAAGFSLATF